MSTASGCRRRAWLAGVAGLALALPRLAGAAQGESTAAEATPTLDKLRARGTLSVAVYQDLPPFHVKGQGIDVALAQALAAKLGLKLSLMPFQADENMADDLRNMVWKGHYLGFGPADLMLHVPVDRPLMQDNPKVKIFAPYYHERIVLARDLQQRPELSQLSDLRGGKVAVAGQTLAGWLMIGADQGAYREQLVTTPKDGTQAAALLQRGEVVAAAGEQSELESVLGRDPARYAIEPLPVPRMRDGWAVGCAVKAESTDLARAVQAAMNELGTSGELKALFAQGGLDWRKP